MAIFPTKQEGNGPWDSRATMVMAPEVKFDFGIELSDLDYPDIHVLIASNEHLNFGGLGGLRGHGGQLEAMAASEVTSDLGFELSNLDYPGIHVHIASNGQAASKRPRRSHLTSKFNSVTSIIYVSMSL